MKKNKKKEKGFFLGRFQPFHTGHYEAINCVLKEVEVLVIGVGSSNKGYTKENPYTFEERKKMIERSLNEGEKCEILGIRDFNNIKEWTKYVKTVVDQKWVVYTGNPITRKLFEKEKYTVRSIKHKNSLSGRALREMMYTGDEWKKHVPKGTLETLLEIKGVERLREITNTRFESPVLAVDTIIEVEEGVILVKRAKEPFKDKYAIPGGHVEGNETVEGAAVREAKEETGLDIEIKKILGVYSEPRRDPRGHYVSVVYICKKLGGELRAASDAKEAKIFSIESLPELGFDHKKIFEDYKKKKQKEMLESIR